LKEKTKHLEGELQQLLDDFASETGFGVAEVLVVEPHHDQEDESSHDQEVEVRLAPPNRERPPKKETKTLGRKLKTLLKAFESGTGCRVTEVLVGQEIYEVQVRIDLLPYPQRFLKDATKRLEGELQEMLCDFARRTQGRVAEVLVTEEGPENYDVQVRIAPPAPESPGPRSGRKEKDGHAPA
jgi:hypothetical protein